jgi:hypothetical protein
MQRLKMSDIKPITHHWIKKRNSFSGKDNGRDTVLKMCFHVSLRECFVMLMTSIFRKSEKIGFTKYVRHYFSLQFLM